MNDEYMQCKDCKHRYNRMVCNSCEQKNPTNFEEE